MPPRSCTTNLSKFFYLYCVFLQKDIFNSVNQHGRNIRVILSFEKILLLIVSGATQGLVNKALTGLEKMLFGYLGTERAAYEKLFKELLQCENIIVATICETSILHSRELKVALTEHARSSSSHQVRHKKLLKQSIIELNNAISHLYAAYRSGREPQKAITKAIVHLHRGALDNYKSNIRSKNIYLSGPDKMRAGALARVRCLELGTIGEDVNGEGKKSLLKEYKDFLLTQGI